MAYNCSLSPPLKVPGGAYEKGMFATFPPQAMNTGVSEAGVKTFQ